ncbi:MAG: gephyrin-like molybdotransferase Glp [Bacteroidota bacterium]
MVSVDEAKKIIAQNVQNVGNEEVQMLAAHGRILATDIVAQDDIPQFDNSSMDGFALRASDTTGATDTSPVTLPLVDEVAAGQTLGRSFVPHSIIRIMTGAPIPPGVDSVIEQEAVSSKNGSVAMQKPVSPGRNIRRKGEDIKCGTTALHKGTMLRAAQLGVLGSLGISMVRVSRRPKTAFLTTGNELVAPDEKLTPGKIRNSNALMLSGLLTESGCEPKNLGVASDREDVLEAKIEEGLAYDALITSGGVSVGKYDLVLEVMRKVGVDIKFWKVNVKPGMPFAFGTHNKTGQSQVHVFCLPGNPVSTMVTFLQFVRPALFRMMGRTEETLYTLKATLEHDIRKEDNKRHFNRGIVRNEDGRLLVRTTGTQSSAVLSSLAMANCLVVIPEETRFVCAGDTVEIELLQ